MSKLTQKIATVSIAIATVATLSGPVFAQSTADLQAQIAALLAQIQALQSQMGSSQGSVVSAYSFTKNLTLGARGADVKALQNILISKGHLKIAAATEYFGPMTKAAVIAWQTAEGISPAAGYVGPLSRAKLNSMGGTTGGSTGGVVVVPATGLQLSLSSDNPYAMTLPKGGANVPFLKFNIAGSGVVNSITVKRVGSGATTDISAVYLYDGANRLTSGRSVNSSSHEVTFSGLNLTVSGVKTITVSADVATGATGSNRDGFQVSNVVGTAAVNGIPVTGNEMTISGASAGTLTAAKSGSIANPNIGQTGAQVSQFRLTAANEDVVVKRIALMSAGTISKSNLTNFVLKNIDGNTVATASGVGAKDLVSFDLSSPITILRGENKTFYVYADIGGASKSGDTVKLYVDEASDVYGVGSQYGQGATVTKTDFDSDAADHHVLTLQGGTVTITFLGPVTGDIAENGKDITLYEFTMAAANNVEVRNLRFDVSVSSTQAGVDDFKVVDKDSGFVIGGPTDNASGTTVLSDVFTINAGQTRKFKVTGDTDTSWSTSDTIKVTLNAFTSGADIKNLDNNQYLVTADEVVPNAAVAGNTLTVKAPTLEVGLAGTPATDSFVKGKQDVPFVGITLRAANADIKVTTIKLTASGGSGAQASSTIADIKADLLNIGLWDGTTQVGTTKTFTGSALPGTATFSNLDLTIKKGDQKTLVVRGNLSVNAVVNNVYTIGIANVADTTGVDVVAVDMEGNEPTYSGDVVNMAGTTKHVTVLSGGSMNIASVSANDSDAKAGILVAGSTGAVISKFQFTANSEDLTVNKLKILVVNDNATSVTATSTAEVSSVYLYDGSTQIGSTGGYSVSSDGSITVEGLNWQVKKDETKTLTVKGNVNSISAGSTSGRELYAHISTDGFEAVGATTVSGFANQGGALGYQKVVYKTYPTVSTVALSGSTLSAPVDLEVARFKVKANSTERIKWASVGLQLGLLNASFSDAALSITDVTGSPIDLTVGTQVPNSSALDLTADGTKQAIIYLATPQEIAAGQEATYVIKLNATTAQFGTANETETLSTRLSLMNDSSTANIANGASYSFGAGARVDGTLDSADNAFVWADFSTSNNATSWANGVYVNTFPSNVWTLSR